MIASDIDNYIISIAYWLDKNATESELIKQCEDSGLLSHDDIFLILTAGRQLHNDRKNAVPVKPVFRRVQ